MIGRTTAALIAACVPVVLAAQVSSSPPAVLPGRAASALAASLEAAAGHARHAWRDTVPFADGGAVHAYVEIPRGDRRKWEFDIRANRRAIDRVIPRQVGGYPVNYGFVPQTISYDGDPFDALVLGPPLPGGRVVRGAVVGLMLMEDEKGADAKVVLSPLDAHGRPAHALGGPEQERIAAFFNRYKRHEPDGYAVVPGWGTPADGRAFVEVTHAFFLRCRAGGGADCRLDD